MLRFGLTVVFVCFASLLCSAQASRAATIHVAKDGTIGNPGTETQPLATIAEAVEHARPGDTIRIHEGRWGETVTPTVSGEAGAPIVLEGVRGQGGEWLTVLDIGNPVTGWEPAPEVGEGVFKTDDLGFNPHSMTLDGKQVLRMHDTRVMEGGTGLEYLALPADAPVQTPYAYYVDELGFWDAVEVIYGSLDGVTYIRFRDGDDPSGMDLRAAPAGGGIQLRDVSHWTIRDLRITNAEDCVVIAGEGAQGNVVEQCFLSNGHNRVVITEGAAHNHIRDNEMTLNYYGFDDPGAWGTSDLTTHSSKRCRVYRTFKLIQGPGGSDDHGVWLRRCGPGNEVSGNHVFAGLIGVSVGDSTDVNVHHNVIHGMSSIGVLTSEDARRGAVDLRVHDNLIYDCNLNIRLHHYNNCLPDARREYFYRNLSWQRPGMGGHVFVHWTSKEISEGCEPPSIYMYHNTFAGGRRGFTSSGWADDGGGNPGIWLLNNIIGGGIALNGSAPYMAGPQMMGPVDHNWIIGAINHGDAAWMGPHNVVSASAEPWSADTLPSFLLAEDSPARGIALDLSQPFEVMGRSHDAFPGIQPGYFAGADPDAGAVQFGQQPPVSAPH